MGLKLLFHLVHHPPVIVAVNNFLVQDPLRGVEWVVSWYFYERRFMNPFYNDRVPAGHEVSRYCLAKAGCEIT